MCDRPWETMTDADFEAMLAQSVPDTPPEEIVAEVTPWRRAMNRILFGMALCAVTLNFWCLNYILPAIGNELIALLKETSVAGYVAVIDVTRAGNLIRNNSYDAVNPLMLVALIYLMLVLLLTWLLGKLERRLSTGDKR